MKCIAFDLGKVLFDFDYTIALRKIKSRINVPIEEVIDELFYKNFADDFEKGLTTAFEFYRKFKKRFSAKVTYQEFKEIWCDIFTPNKEIIKIAQDLSLTYPLYLISNINELHFEYLLKKYPETFSLFKELILSFKVKSLKPERQIYAKLKKVCGHKYQDIVYIDDRHDLIHQARKLKIECIHFNTLCNLLSALKSLGIVLPDNKSKKRRSC